MFFCETTAQVSYLMSFFTQMLILHQVHMLTLQEPQICMYLVISTCVTVPIVKVSTWKARAYKAV